MRETIRKKIVSIPTLQRELQAARAAGKRVVQCHGCFDVVHPGHVRHLNDAAEQGDLLVVSVTADPQVDKGLGRPYVPQELRCESLAALAMVDFVVVDAESWAGPLLEKLRPDVYVKGLEYSTNNDPRFLREKEIVEQYGGVVVYTSGEVVYSSTRLGQEHLHDREIDDERLRAILSRYQITRASLVERVRQFSSLKVLVVGDVLIDHYVECEQLNVSAEAPILQVSPIDERHYVGGAGVLALHLANMGAAVTYVGFMSPAGTTLADEIRRELQEAGVTIRWVASGPPLIKTRYLVEGQKVFKVDRCRPLSISSAEDAHWGRLLSESLSRGCSGIVAVDFGYGTLTLPRMRCVAQFAEAAHASVFGDTSAARYASLAKFAGLMCDSVFPNESEARAYLGEPEAGLPLLASELFRHQIAKAIVLTLGSRGLVLFEQDRQSADASGQVRYLPEYLPSLAPHAVDTLGAGDVLTAMASLTRLAGGSHVEAALLGSLAAALIVGRLGNEPLQLAALMSAIERHPILDG